MNEELKNTINIFNQYAALYAEKYEDVSIYTTSLELYLNKIPKQAQVLELGCGPGNITSYLASKRPDLKIVATDMAEDMLKIGKKKVPSASFEIFNFKDLRSYKGEIDSLMAGFCLPYSSYSETIELFKAASEKMAKKGLFYLSTMEGSHKISGIQKSSSGKNEMMLYFYEENWLLQQLENTGFRIKYSELIPQPENSKSSGQDVVIIAENS